MVVTGCTSSAPQQPGPSSGVVGSNVPQTRPGQQGTGLIPPDSVTGSVLSSSSGTGTAGPPAAPEAATLSWLTGTETGGGVVLDTAAGQRWQGPVPGAYALISEQGYSWFGPDGSMVGCTAKGACVGVDDDGRIAVTTRHKGPRLVYDANGHFVGRFSPDGDRMSAPTDLPTLTKALAGTGVDMPDLVNAATLAAPFAGGATGDPHLITAGGVRVTTQDVGQFVARAGDPNHAIQLQFAPMEHRDDVSLVSAVAIGTGGDTVTVDMTGALTIDGTVQPDRSAFDQTTLSSGVAIGRWPPDSTRVVTVAVVWPDGGSVVMDANPALGMTVVAHLVPVASSAGLFGAGGQGVGPDLLSRGGTSEDTGKLVSSWAVTRSERLFTSGPESDSRASEKTPSPDPGAEQMAQQTCAAQGLLHAEDIAACTFDVALTGDTGFVAGHLALDVPAERDPIAGTFAGRWPALLPGSLVGAPDLPSGGRLSVTLGSKKSKVFRITLDDGGVITLINRTGCGVGQNLPGIDQPAMRLFDGSGHAVSDRFALCGHEQTSTLSAGTYNLVVANGPSSSDLSVRVDVTLP